MTILEILQTSEDSEQKTLPLGKNSGITSVWWAKLAVSFPAASGCASLECVTEEILQNVTVGMFTEIHWFQSKKLSKTFVM